MNMSTPTNPTATVSHPATAYVHAASSYGCSSPSEGAFEKFQVRSAIFFELDDKY